MSKDQKTIAELKAKLAKLTNKKDKASKPEKPAKKVAKSDKKVKTTKKVKGYDHTSHNFGYKKIVQFFVNDKPKSSGEVETILGTRSLQRYRDNPGTAYKVGKYAVITKVADKKIFNSRPRHK